MGLYTSKWGDLIDAESCSGNLKSDGPFGSVGRMTSLWRLLSERVSLMGVSESAIRLRSLFLWTEMRLAVRNSRGFFQSTIEVSVGGAKRNEIRLGGFSHD